MCDKITQNLYYIFQAYRFKFKPSILGWCSGRLTQTVQQTQKSSPVHPPLFSVHPPLSQSCIYVPCVILWGRGGGGGGIFFSYPKLGPLAKFYTALPPTRSRGASPVALEQGSNVTVQGGASLELATQRPDFLGTCTINTFSFRSEGSPFPRNQEFALVCSKYSMTRANMHTVNCQLDSPHKHQR